MIIKKSINKNPYYDPSKSHHTPTGFCNPQQTVIRFANLRHWMFERLKNGYPRPPQNGYQQFINQWVTQSDFSSQKNHAWWLGHACVLLKLGQHYTITDPIFAKRASPLAMLGPKRRTPNPFEIQQLPKIDVVAISHNHYDHLDRYSIKVLLKRNPNTHFVVPLGLKSWFKRIGATHIIELDWWQSTVINGLKYTAVPARHWSRRNKNDTNQTLWCGWVISQEQRHFYFAGDTGYCTSLSEIGQQFAIEMAFLPIGAYAPRWFMSQQHIDPEEAVRLHQELACKRSLAIHWGTFELADESIHEPPQLLRQACSERQIDEQEFILLPIGGQIELC